MAYRHELECQLSAIEQRLARVARGAPLDDGSSRRALERLCLLRDRLQKELRRLGPGPGAVEFRPTPDPDPDWEPLPGNAPSWAQSGSESLETRPWEGVLVPRSFQGWAPRDTFDSLEFSPGRFQEEGLVSFRGLVDDRGVWWKAHEVRPRRGAFLVIWELPRYPHAGMMTVRVDVRHLDLHFHGEARGGCLRSYAMLRTRDNPVRGLAEIERGLPVVEASAESRSGTITPIHATLRFRVERDQAAEVHLWHVFVVASGGRRAEVSGVFETRDARGTRGSRPYLWFQMDPPGEGLHPEDTRRSVVLP